MERKDKYCKTYILCKFSGMLDSGEPMLPFGLLVDLRNVHGIMNTSGLVQSK